MLMLSHHLLVRQDFHRFLVLFLLCCPICVSGLGLSCIAGNTPPISCRRRSIMCVPFLFCFWEFQGNPMEAERVSLLKEVFQLLWALSVHTPLPFRDMAQGAGVFNTMVNK